MDETDKEYRKIFEETTTRNVRASISFSNDTRQLVQALAERVEKLETQNRLLSDQLTLLRTQLAPIQTRLFSGGT